MVDAGFGEVFIHHRTHSHGDVVADFKSVAHAGAKPYEAVLAYIGETSYHGTGTYKRIRAYAAVVFHNCSRVDDGVVAETSAVDDCSAHHCAPLADQSIRCDYGMWGNQGGERGAHLFIPGNYFPAFKHYREPGIHKSNVQGVPVFDKFGCIGVVAEPFAGKIRRFLVGKIAYDFIFGKLGDGQGMPSGAHQYQFV